MVHHLRKSDEGLASLPQRALSALREMILTGQLAPGARLFEVPLAEQLGLSRTPLRAALSRLEAEGLLVRSRGGLAVRQFTHADAIDAMDLRGLIEGMAARLAAERGVEASALAAIQSTVADLDIVCAAAPSAVDVAEYARLNADFHANLARLSGSELVQREAERILTLPFAAPSSFVSRADDPETFGRGLIAAQAQHRAMIEAIVAREGVRAEAIAREHARIPRAVVLRALATHVVPSAKAAS